MPGATEGSTGPMPSTVRGMFDATCSKCKKRFGWYGTLFDKPPCPRCKHHDKVNPDDPDAKAVLEMEALLRKRMLEDEEEGKIDGVD